MSAGLDRQFADEVARRAARRLEILRKERPDLLAERLATMDPDVLSDLLELTRLPAPLAHREPTHHHLGVAGVDHCTNRLVVRRRRWDPRKSAAAEEPDLAALDDDDLLAARRYVPETLPGNVLG
jgi:hypothetical protein